MTVSGLADLHVAVAKRLDRAGPRYTAGRRAVVEVLAMADGPLTIPEMLAASADLVQSSTYRNVALLERAGIVHRVVGTGEFARFELAEMVTEDHHHHLICDRCGAIEDFSVPPELERRLEAALDEIAADTGFDVEHHRFDLVGRCAACRSDGA